ncbi:MAG TPA: DNA polymerase III subunit delta [Anaerolineales bacterium]|jgi:DNA polymerase-3 subunit delta
MKNIFFLYGNDEFAIAGRLKEFEADFPDATSADMNTARLDARGMLEDELNNAVNAMPFLAASRLVILANPTAKYNTPSARKKFEDFLDKAPETARIVLHEWVETKTYKDPAKEEKDDEKHWLVKWGRKAGIKLERHALPAGWQMTGWIVNEAKSQGGEIAAPAAARLAEMAGVDTRQASQEIAKLLAYVNWARPVKVGDVEAVSIVTAQESVFDFVDALAMGNGGAAQHLLHRLLESDDPFSVWGMVVRQFRLLLQAREILDARGGKEQVASALGVHPFVAEKTAGQAKRFTLPVLEAIHHKLLGIDEAVKTGQVTLDLAMDMLVVELTRV